MDKKKVIELISNVEKYLINYEKSGKNADIATAFQQLHEAEAELQKSDWISVEDELPPYDEEVWVTSKKFPSHIYKSWRLEASIDPKDSHDFVVLWEGRISPITHWRKIDKLEV